MNEEVQAITKTMFVSLDSALIRLSVMPSMKATLVPYHPLRLTKGSTATEDLSANFRAGLSGEETTVNRFAGCDDGCRASKIAAAMIASPCCRPCTDVATSCGPFLACSP